MWNPARRRWGDGLECTFAIEEILLERLSIGFPIKAVVLRICCLVQHGTGETLRVLALEMMENFFGLKPIQVVLWVPGRCFICRKTKIEFNLGIEGECKNIFNPRIKRNIGGGTSICTECVIKECSRRTLRRIVKLNKEEVEP